MLLRHLPMIILGACFAANLTYMIIERRRHQANLNKIAVRILVNGSRGKSSTTRLVRAALAADKQRLVVAKTTGSAARFIYPAGKERPIIRKNSIVNVIEQIAVIARAAAVKAHTVVIECMAVDPLLQRLNQDVLIQSQIGVITNVRPDHLDEMGGPDRTVEGVARSLCEGMPVGGICFTAERDLYPILLEEATRRNCRLEYVDPDSVTDAEMRHFPWICFPDNVAIALAIAEYEGVPRQAALAAMYAADPDPGVLRVDDCHHNGVRFKAVNLFAANDPQSTCQNLDLLRKRRLVTGGISLLINCRPDRAERNGQMGAIAEAMGAETIYLIGEPTKSAADHIPAHLQDRIVHLEGDRYTGVDVLEAIVARMPADPHHAIVLVGNIHGAGESLLHALHEAATHEPTLDEELAELTHTAALVEHTAVDLREHPMAGRPIAPLHPTVVWQAADDGDPTVLIPLADDAPTRVLYLDGADRTHEFKIPDHLRR
jgi:poly-gamma-glutamate synthase PgsB/CapB